MLQHSSTLRSVTLRDTFANRTRTSRQSRRLCLGLRDPARLCPNPTQPIFFVSNHPPPPAHGTHTHPHHTLCILAPCAYVPHIDDTATPSIEPFTRNERNQTHRTNERTNERTHTAGGLNGGYYAAAMQQAHSTTAHDSAPPPQSQHSSGSHGGGPLSLPPPQSSNSGPGGAPSQQQPPSVGGPPQLAPVSIVAATQQQQQQQPPNMPPTHGGLTSKSVSYSNVIRVQT